MRILEVDRRPDPRPFGNIEPGSQTAGKRKNSHNSKSLLYRAVFLPILLLVVLLSCGLLAWIGIWKLVCCDIQLQSVF
jgi:hypothetical protein